MKALERISTIDRRLIYLAVAIAVILPFFLSLGLPVQVSPPVQQLFDVIEGLPEKAVVLISIDYDPSGAPELQPATLAVMHHCFRRDLRVLVLGLWATGVPLGVDALEETAVTEFNKQYGVDFVNFGYKPGGAVTLVNLGRDIHDVCRQDIHGTPVEEIPMMEDVKTANDIALVLTMSMGIPGSDQWLWYYHGRYGGLLATAQTAIGAPRYYQYLQSGQLVGLIGGMKGSAEYERLIGRRGFATTGMDSQSIAHLLIIGFVILGNIVYWLEKKEK